MGPGQRRTARYESLQDLVDAYDAFLGVVSTETPEAIDIIDVETLPGIPQGEGIGTRFMIDAKHYADATGKRLVATNVRNPGFFASLGFMHPGPDRTFVYDPGRVSRVATMTRNQYLPMAELEQKMGPDKSRLHHQFNNGWAVTAPKTQRDIKRTGILMGHCWQSGFAGGGDPYVLRDPDGIPRVAFSANALHTGTRMPLRLDDYEPGQQIMVNNGTHAPVGHNNSPPKPEHWDMLREWAAAQSPPVKMWHYTGQEGEYQRPVDVLGEPGPNPYWDPQTQTFKASHARTCPTCGDPLTGDHGTFCPRCSWSEHNPNLDSDPLSNPPDPTVDMHRGIQSHFCSTIPSHRWFAAVEDSP